MSTSGWVRGPDGWRHAPRWKVLVNRALRFFQTRQRPARLLVVFTKAENIDDASDVEPTTIGFGIGRVLHLPER